MGTCYTVTYMGKNLTNYAEKRNKVRNDFRSNLTEVDVKEIRRLHRDEGLSYAKLGAQFGVRKDTIYKMCTGITWQHIAQ